MFKSFEKIHYIYTNIDTCRALKNIIISLIFIIGDFTPRDG